LPVKLYFFTSFLPFLPLLHDIIPWEMRIVNIPLIYISLTDRVGSLFIPKAYTNEIEKRKKMEAK
jgi:hypothetical protein